MVYDIIANDVGNACLLGFDKAMQFLSKFQKICYGAPPPDFFFFFCFWIFSHPSITPDCPLLTYSPIYLN